MAIGRPRSFDVDLALDQALSVFWEKGYEGTTLPDLTAAMGINRPSLYAAFGNKESLFRKAIDRYTQGPASHVGEALKAPTARAVVEQLLLGSIHLVTDPSNPRGCFLVQGALACGDTGERIRQEMTHQRTAFEGALRERFERSVAEGDLPADSDAATLARYVTILAHGMAVQAASGASREDLKLAAELALRAWPT